jgi:hypothetical protein
MGVKDSYPFVLPGPAIEKLRFVHEIVSECAAADAEAHAPEVRMASVG